jgi:hypothetical protein
MKKVLISFIMLVTLLSLGGCFEKEKEKEYVVSIKIVTSGYDVTIDNSKATVGAPFKLKKGNHTVGWKVGEGFGLYTNCSKNFDLICDSKITIERYSCNIE